MLFIKPSNYSNNRTKVFYETNTRKRSKSSFENKLGLTIVDSIPCKMKGRPKKIKENENCVYQVRIFL